MRSRRKALFPVYFSILKEWKSSLLVSLSWVILSCGSGGGGFTPVAELSPESPTTSEPSEQTPALLSSSHIVLVGETLDFDLEQNGPLQAPIEVQIESVSPGLQVSILAQTVSVVANLGGRHQIQLKPIANGQAGEISTVDVFAIAPEPQQQFWIRSEEIEAVVGPGDEVPQNGALISDWRDRITNQSPRFPNSARTPRLKTQFGMNSRKSFRSVDFEFATGAQATNDLMWYPGTFVYSPSGHLNIFAVALNKGFASSIAPVVSQGVWLNRGWGLNWNSLNAGIGSPTQFGGRDDRLVTQSITGHPALLTGQIFPATASMNGDGLQRVRFNSGTWVASEVGLSLTQMTATEVAAQNDPNNNGAPIMIGANNRHSTQPDRRFFGEIAEVLVIAEALGDEDVQVIESALKQKYGL